MSAPSDQPNRKTQMPTMENVKYLPQNGGRVFAPLGHSLSFIAEPEDTEGNHETFYVLEGTLEIEADGEHNRVGTGEFLSLRPGVVHSLHNPGPGMTRILTLVSPGSQHVRFFSTLGEPIEDPSNPPAPDG